MSINQGPLSKLPVFFIVGRGRSGSTLLRTMFDAHPSIIIPPESRFVQYLYYQYGTNQNWTPELAQLALNYTEQSFEPPLIDEAYFHKLIQLEKDNLSFSAVCKAIYLSIHSTFNKETITCIGDKNPRYSFFIPLLFKIFPEAKFIHLVRDYRDKALAIKCVHKIISETNSLPVILSRWKYYNSIIEKYKSRHTERFYTLRFEDLINDPEIILRQLCTFLNLDFNPCMLNYSTRFNAGNHEPFFSILHSNLQHPVDKSKAVVNGKTNFHAGKRLFVNHWWAYPAHVTAIYQIMFPIYT
jgi:hypothetical protein